MYLVGMRLIRGYVRFELRGVGLEEAINRSLKNGVLLWNLKRKGSVIVGMTTPQSYKRLARCARQCGGKTHIVNKRGLPFFIRRVSRRPGIIIGIMLFFALLIFSQNFIWKIDIKDYNGRYYEYLLEVMNQKGLSSGRYSKGLDIRVLQQEILMEIEEISWLALNLNGSVLEVEVSEKTIPPFILQKYPANVVAKKTGQILRVDTYKGMEMVRPLDVVYQGDLLVSGILVNEEGTVTHEHADAKVIAKTQDTHTIRFKLEQQEPIYTGDSAQRRYIQILGLNIPLFIAFRFAEEYEKEEVYRPLVIGKTEFAVGIKTDTYQFFKPKSVSYTEQQARELVLAAFEAYEQQKSYDKVLSRADTEQIQDGVFSITRKYECEEEISKKLPLYIEEDRKTNDFS